MIAAAGRQGIDRYTQLCKGLLGIDAKGSFWELRQIIAVGAGRVQALRLDIGRPIKLLIYNRLRNPRDDFAEILFSLHGRCHHQAGSQQERKSGFPHGAFLSICLAVLASQSQDDNA